MSDTSSLIGKSAYTAALPVSGGLNETTVLLYRDVRLVEAIRFTMRSLDTIIVRLGNWFRLLSDGTNVIINIAGSNKALETNPNEEGHRPKILVITNPDNADDTTFVTEGQWVVFTDRGIRAMDDDEFRYCYRLYEHNSELHYTGREDTVPDNANPPIVDTPAEDTVPAEEPAPEAAAEAPKPPKKKSTKSKKN